MNRQHKQIRALISSMAPLRAISYIQAFQLPEEEEVCLIEMDVRKRSYIQIANALNMSPETVKKRRRSAFSKIADQLNHPI